MTNENSASQRPIGHGSKPNHAARAVDIATCFPPAPDSGESTKRVKATEAGARGVSAAPMSIYRREANYLHQTGRPALTDRQNRRAEHKSRHVLANLAGGAR